MTTFVTIDKVLDINGTSRCALQSNFMIDQYDIFLSKSFYSGSM